MNRNYHFKCPSLGGTSLLLIFKPAMDLVRFDELQWRSWGGVKKYIFIKYSFHNKFGALPFTQRWRYAP